MNGVHHKTILLTIILTTILPVLIFAQEQFRTGVYVTLPPDKDSLVNVQQISDMGPNTVISHSRYTNRDSLYILFDSVIVFNAFSASDFVHHYTAGCYTRWEAEENVDTSDATPGVKHEFGSGGSGYWQSGLDEENIGSLLVTGPDYVQDRNYKLWYNRDSIVYIVNFRMKIDGDLTPDTPVCEISVRYITKGNTTIDINSKILYADDLSNSYAVDTLHYFLPKYVSDEPVEEGEIIADAFRSYSSDYPQDPPEADAYGIQFNVKWLGHRNLYVDYIEVYDEAIWGYYRLHQSEVITNIKDYADTAGPANTSYWYALDEPHSIDNYEPYRIVDSILADDSKPPLITAFYPGWDGLRNNEYSMERFLEKAQPQELMYDYYPFYYDVGSTEYTDAVCLEIQRSLLQEPYDHDFSRDDYYYVAQAFGFTPHCSESPDNVHQRKPTSAQLRAETMMALAHGAKGIFYWNYYSYAKYDSTCEVKLLIDAIVDSFGTPSNLYYTLRDTIFPRLNGDLGEGLFRINYTGDYITYQCSGGGFAQSPITLDYLTLPGLPPTETTSLQAGFFSREGHSDDKYFFLVNLLTNATKSIVIKVTPPVGGFTNYRLRDYEGVFDTTFTSSPFYLLYSHTLQGMATSMK